METAVIKKPSGTIYYHLYPFERWIAEEFAKDYTGKQLQVLLHKFHLELSKHNTFTTAQLWAGYYQGKRDNFSKFMREVFKRFGTDEINLMGC